MPSRIYGPLNTEWLVDLVVCLLVCKVSRKLLSVKRLLLFQVLEPARFSYLGLINDSDQPDRADFNKATYAGELGNYGIFFNFTPITVLFIAA